MELHLYAFEGNFLYELFVFLQSPGRGFLRSVVPNETLHLFQKICLYQKFLLSLRVE